MSGILAHQVAISETAGSEISVLAELWGEREALTPRILRCRADGRPDRLKLIEHGAGIVSDVTVAADRDPAHLVLVPWILCMRDGQTLMRAHAQEPWGDLSCLAQRCAIVSADQAAAPRLLANDSCDRAFAALVDDCPQSPPAVGSGTGDTP